MDRKDLDMVSKTLKPINIESPKKFFFIIKSKNINRDLITSMQYFDRETLSIAYFNSGPPKPRKRSLHPDYRGLMFLRFTNYRLFTSNICTINQLPMVWQILLRLHCKRVDSKQWGCMFIPILLSTSCIRCKQTKPLLHRNKLDYFLLCILDEVSSKL